MSPGKSVACLGTKTSNPAESRVGETEKTKIPLWIAVIVSGVTHASISWFPDPCILPVLDTAPQRGL